MTDVPNILQFPQRPSRQDWDGDAAPQVPRLAPGAALLAILSLGLALWAALIWGAIALCEAIVNG